MDRVQKRLQDTLMYDPAVPPAKMLEQLREDERNGYEAYQMTPLVIGPLHLTVNFVAIGIAALITAILVLGIRESAGFNATMVLIKVAAVLFVIVAGIGHIDPSNWSPFLPYGIQGMLAASGVIFFAYIGFDSVSCNAEEARNPTRDVPIAIIGSWPFARCCTSPWRPW